MDMTIGEDKQLMRAYLNTNVTQNFLVGSNCKKARIFGHTDCGAKYKYDSSKAVVKGNLQDAEFTKIDNEKGEAKFIVNPTVRGRSVVDDITFKGFRESKTLKFAHVFEIEEVIQEKISD